MIKKIAWDAFKNTGDINTFLEYKQIENIENEMKETQEIDEKINTYAPNFIIEAPPKLLAPNIIVNTDLLSTDNPIAEGMPIKNPVFISFSIDTLSFVLSFNTFAPDIIGSTETAKELISIIGTLIICV